MEQERNGLVIRREQLEELHKGSFLGLRPRLPEGMRALTEGEWRAFIERSRRAATSHGIVIREEQARFILLEAHHGISEADWARPILEDPFHSSLDKLSKLEQRAAQG